MKKIERAYYYLFYKLYKFWEWISYPKFWSDFKAIVSITALEMWLIGGLINYYRIYIDHEMTFSKNFYIGMAIFFAVLNYIIFIHTDKWKDYNAEFDQLPRKKNIIGGIIVWIIIISIIFGFFRSAYLLQKNVLGM